MFKRLKSNAPVLEKIKKGASAARPQRSNMPAYGAIGAAALLGLYFFHGPDVPQPDRENVTEEDGVIRQHLDANLFGGLTPGEGKRHEAPPDEAGTDETIAEAAGEGASPIETDAMPVGAGVANVLSDVLGPALGTKAEAATTSPLMIATSTAEAVANPGGLMVPATTEEVVTVLPDSVSTAANPVSVASSSEAGTPLPPIPSKEEAKPDQEVSVQERADRGDPDAMFEIAGSIVKTDDNESAKRKYRYMAAAANRGHVLAMKELAIMLDSGTGTNANPRVAFAWATLATAFGEDMTPFRQRLANQMSDQELASGQRTAEANLKDFGDTALAKAKSFKTTPPGKY